MRKKKNTTNNDDLIKLLKASIEAEKRKDKELREKLKMAFKPLPGAHANNCDVCKYKTICTLASYNFSFCPKQKRTDSEEYDYTSDHKALGNRGMFIIPLN